MRLAPVELFPALRPAVWRIFEPVRVVLVLPLVPVIATEPSRSRRESFVTTLGSTVRATTPGTVEPPPVRRVRLASLAARAARIAAERCALAGSFPMRSEVPRVGKECRSRWPPYHLNKYSFPLPPLALLASSPF